MPSWTASCTPRTASPSTARPCENQTKNPPNVASLTPTSPSEPLKPSTGDAVRDHRITVRDRSEPPSAIAGIRNEARDALHHPLTRAFAANVNVTVVRIANKTVSPVLQLAVEFVEHEVTEQWRKRSSLRSSFHARADQPILHHPGIQKGPDELQQPLVLDALGNLAHQFVVIDSIEEFFQIEVDHPSVALRDVLLRLSHGVMRRPPRSEPIAV